MNNGGMQDRVGRRGSGRLMLWLALVALGWGPAAAGRGADALFYGVVKLHQYEQALGSVPNPLESNGFVFTAFVLNATNNSVTNATVKVPGSATVRPLVSVTNGIARLFQESYDTSTALDAAYPSSASLFNPSVYQLTLSGVSDGTRTASLSYWLVTPPPTPRLANLAAAQTVDTTADFTLEWEAPGGIVLDLVQLALVDSAGNLAFASPLPFEPGALTGNSSSVTIPAYMLPPGAQLSGHLVIARTSLPNTDSVPGAVGVASLAKDVAFALVTRPPPLAPRLGVVSTAGNRLTLEVQGEPNRNYRLQHSTDLRQWQDLLVTNLLQGSVQVTDPQVIRSVDRRFYRMQVGP